MTVKLLEAAYRLKEGLDLEKLVCSLSLDIFVTYHCDLLDFLNNVRNKVR